MMSFAEIIAQNNEDVHYYYLTEESYDLLKPTNITTKADKTLSLEFSQTHLTNYFSDKVVYEYKREYEWSKFDHLHKYYLVGFDDEGLTNELITISGIINAEYIGTQEMIEGLPLETPNDYFDHAYIHNYWLYTQSTSSGGFHISNLRAYEHLELINARRAWNITKGSSDVKIGIRDIDFNSNHPDISNKIITHVGSEGNGAFGWHGLRVSSVAAGETNNGIGLASIGYNSALVTATGAGMTGGHAGIALNLAENHNVKVVNISMGSPVPFSSVQAEVFQTIHDSLEVSVIVAAGNGFHHVNTSSDEYFYPASYDHVISVSSVGSYQKYGHQYNNGHSVGWKDVHQWVVGNEDVTHQHNDKVDIVAPGYNVPIATSQNEYIIGRGTSYASPIVAGVAALMYDVHPTITAEDVKNILKNTADDIYHIPQNYQYQGLLGSGRVNAYAAVLQAKCMADGYPAGLDLTMQNSSTDFGEEPDTETEVIWESPDIWVRNNPDGFLYKESENLHYQGPNSTAYVYVRITNDSCETSSGNDLLELYWAKGGLSQSWPNVWKGWTNTLIEFGNNVGIQNIPVLNPGQSTILEFEWTPGNPQVYANLGFDKPLMFCFLARIESADDPMTFSEGSSAANNARNNNNIAYKNETVINVVNRPNKGSIVVGNLGGQNALTSSIEFFTTTPQDHNIWQEAEVRAELNEDLWDLWQNSGAQSTAVRVIDPNRREIMLLDNGASLDNITFARDEWGIATMSVNFLINEVGAQDEFTFHVQQCDSSNQETLGGFTYTFNRDNQRAMFSAGYSSSTNNDHTETLYASSINEEATYNWYDEEGNLVYSGSDFTVNSLVAKKYKLEVIAEGDGHKDYSEIETEDKRKITSVSPNPASTTTEVEYLIAPNDNAYIMVTNSVTGVNHNFMINNQTNTINIPLHYLTTGAYIINLIIDGNIIDAKHLIKQ